MSLVAFLSTQKHQLNAAAPRSRNHPQQRNNERPPSWATICEGSNTRGRLQAGEKNNIELRTAFDWVQKSNCQAQHLQRRVAITGNELPDAANQ
jgi:hypothetical protein